jgi:hypothetical protein
MFSTPSWIEYPLYDFIPALKSIKKSLKNIFLYFLYERDPFLLQHTKTMYTQFVNGISLIITYLR